MKHIKKVISILTFVAFLYNTTLYAAAFHQPDFKDDLRPHLIFDADILTYEKYGDNLTEKIRKETKASIEKKLEWYREARKYYTLYSERDPGSNARILSKLYELSRVVMESIALEAGFEHVTENPEDVLLIAKRKEIKSYLLNKMRESNKDIYKIIKKAESPEAARKALISYLDGRREALFSDAKDSDFSGLADNERSIIYGIINSFQRMLQPYFINAVNDALKKEDNKAQDYSMIEFLWQLDHSESGNLESLLKKTETGFFYELIHLFTRLKGDIRGRFAKDVNVSIVMGMANKMEGNSAAELRDVALDFLSISVDNAVIEIDHGLSPSPIEKYEKNKERILKALNATESDWNDYKWHTRHVLRTRADLEKIGTKLTYGEKKAIDALNENKRIFSITPHHMALMDQDMFFSNLAMRRQVMPEEEHLMWELLASSDVMREKDTSPTSRIVRRYAKICIINVIDSCFQDCRYCQRARLQKLGDATVVSTSDIESAIEYVRGNKAITQVLITGGDPLKMSTKRIEWILKELCSIKHVATIRIGTRALVVLPQRFDDGLLGVLEKYNKIKPIRIVTHFEHSREVTPYTREAVRKIKKLGINILNQQVFNRYVSSRYVAPALNMALVDIGIRPYYIFFPKPKKEQRAYFTPIARLLQMWQEEMRVLPGINRTGQIVFNVPAKGKMQLIDAAAYKLIGILPNGQRAYAFSSWYYGLLKDPKPYIHFDVSIVEYLEHMESEMGEDPGDYASIWDYGYGGSTLGFLYTIARLRDAGRIGTKITRPQIAKHRMKDKNGAKFSYSTVWKEFEDANSLGFIRKLKEKDGKILRDKNGVAYEIVSGITKRQLDSLDEAIRKELRKGRIRKEKIISIREKITKAISTFI